MQSINNNPYIKDQQKNKKIIFIGILVAAIIIFVVVAVILSRSSQTDEQINERVDEPSGEIVSDPANREPETYRSGSAQPIYLGFSELLKYGVTVDQLEAAKLGFFTYSFKLPERIGEVSIYKDSIKSLPFERGEDTLRGVSFNVRIDNKDEYQARLESTDINSAELILTRNNSEVFRSGIIDPHDEIGH